MLEIRDLRSEVVVTYIYPTNVIKTLIVDLISEVAFNYLQNWVMVVNKLNNYWQEKRISKL
jgi:ethanolamine ammonia-lyase large subunit